MLGGGMENWEEVAARTKCDVRWERALVSARSMCVYKARGGLQSSSSKRIWVRAVARGLRVLMVGHIFMGVVATAVVMMDVQVRPEQGTVLS